jgi:thiamine-monophosphate kinase
MLLTEFQSIGSYLSQQSLVRSDVVVGIGDDCAVLRLPSDKELAVSIDTMVESVHFPKQTLAHDLGHKALAVSLSDLAAMGAEPAWATLALTLREIDENWIKSFCAGLFELATRFNVQLVGGDVTQGPLTVSTQLHGFLDKGKAIQRGGAQPGDDIYVTGKIGEAGLGLLLEQGKITLEGISTTHADSLCQRLYRPQPRIDVGMGLHGIASAAIDVSDGVAADLNHLLRRSNVGAQIYVERLPVSDVFLPLFDAVGGWNQPLSAGDDYELLFTAAPNKAKDIEQLEQRTSCPVTRVGKITRDPGLRCLLHGSPWELRSAGYEHFV